MFNFLSKSNIGNPPWDYYFLVNLDEKEYPRYLAKLFKLNTGENLPLRFDFKSRARVIDKKRCKTFNQKIQWLKLYGVTDLMRRCTDKVAVREYVKEKIGEEYLKPALQIIPAPIEEPSHSEVNDTLMPKNLNRMEKKSMPRPCDTSASNGCPPQYDGKTNDVSTYFDQIQWDKLPNSFVIKCNHGCKWQYIIKDKENFLNTPQLFEAVKQQMTGWLEQEYFPWNGFELQYKCIESKILIEFLMKDEINKEPIKLNVYCFNGKPKIFIKFFNQNKMSIWNENFEHMDNIFNFQEENIKTKIDDYIKQTIDLSMELSKDFEFVRCDWMIYKNKIYFEELTFTPDSGLMKFDIKWNKKLGFWIEI